MHQHRSAATTRHCSFTFSNRATGMPLDLVLTSRPHSTWTQAGLMTTSTTSSGTSHGHVPWTSASTCRCSLARPAAGRHGCFDINIHLNRHRQARHRPCHAWTTTLTRATTWSRLMDSYLVGCRHPHFLGLMRVCRVSTSLNSWNSCMSTCDIPQFLYSSMHVGCRHPSFLGTHTCMSDVDMVLALTHACCRVSTWSHVHVHGPCPTCMTSPLPGHDLMLAAGRPSTCL